MCNVRKLSFYSLTLIGLQEGERGTKYIVCCNLLIWLAVHIAFDVALLTKRETTGARFNEFYNHFNSTTREG